MKHIVFKQREARELKRWIKFLGCTTLLTENTLIKAELRWLMAMTFMGHTYVHLEQIALERSASKSWSWFRSIFSNKHKKCHVNLQILQIDFHSKSRQIRHVIDFQIDVWSTLVPLSWMLTSLPESPDCSPVNTDSTELTAHILMRQCWISAAPQEGPY